LNKPKKKLLYLAVCDPDLQVTGATVRMGAFVKHLARYYDVTLVNMAGSGHRVDPEIVARFHDSNNRLGVSQRVRVEFSRLGYFLFSPALYRATHTLLSNGSFHYLLVDYGLAAIYGTLFARRYGIPLIYSSHNVEYRIYLDLSRYDFRRALLAPYVYWAERAACRTATVVVAISENDCREYTRWIEVKKIKIIPQGFDPEFCNPFYAPPPSSPAIVLFVGNFRDKINRQAARQVVRKIVPTVIQARPDTKFQFIGADPPSDLTGPNIECLGFVDDLAPYWRRANLVISPMPLAYGMATKIIIALAFGKTVLSTPQGAGAIPRKYRQLVVAPIDMFASKIVELLARGTSVEASDFEMLCNDFGWPSLMAQLYQGIEQACMHSPCVQSCQY
jgi:glycosyltransferase involved in cell wall biosynthesis